MADLTLYLPSSGAADHDVAYSGSWNSAPSANRYAAVTSRISSAMSNKSRTDSSATNPYKMACTMHVSAAQAARNWTTADKISGVIRCIEQNADADMSLYLVIRVFSADGATERGVLYDGEVNSTEWDAATSTARYFDDVAVQNAVTQQANDHIVIELGFIAKNTFATSRSGAVVIGDNSGSDLPLNNTATDAYNPWIAFTYGSSATAKSVSDTGAGSETVSVLAKVAVPDSGAGNDGLGVQGRAAVADIGAGADLLTALARIVLADAASGADLVSLLARVPVSDLGAAIDAVSRVIEGASKNVSDSGTGMDLVTSLLARVAVGDGGWGADFVAIRAALEISDVGSGSEAVSKSEGVVGRLVSDSGSGVELVAAVARVLIQESAIGADLIASIMAHVSVQDLGVGQDRAFVWIVGTAIALELLRPSQRIVPVPESPRIVFAKAAQRIVPTARD